MPLTACRSCAGTELHEVLSLGEMPLANSLLTEDDLATAEPVHPLELVVCATCSLLQLSETVPPAELFSEYAYFSSHSGPMVTHAKALVDAVLDERRLGPGNLVVEIGSNDGYLLQHYVARGIPTLGIDPAANVVEAARERGVPTLCEFLSPEVAERLRSEGNRADVIHANNVLAHVPDINGFVAAIARLLSDDGVAVIETPYARDLVERLEFDTIYHEHVFYYSARSLELLFERHGLEIVRIDRVPIHGGSLRVYASHRATEGATPVLEIADEEMALHMDDVTYYQGFSARVERLLESLRAFLRERKDAGKRLAGYGAAAKATVMLNALHVGPETIEFVADSTPYKQGRYIPGVRVPVVDPSRLLEEMPDEVLIFAWNFAESIVDRESEYRRRGGVFLVPVPEPAVVGGGRMAGSA
jgi:SAM-dependent methyltransferase